MTSSMAAARLSCLIDGPLRMNTPYGSRGERGLGLAVSASRRYLEAVDAATALVDIRGYATANRIRILRHAWERMGERGAQYEDVRHALAGARRCKAADQGRWQVFGDDRDGDELILVVFIESGVVVVTVY